MIYAKVSSTEFPDSIFPRSAMGRFHRPSKRSYKCLRITSGASEHPLFRTARLSSLTPISAILKSEISGNSPSSTYDVILDPSEAVCRFVQPSKKCCVRGLKNSRILQLLFLGRFLRSSPPFRFWCFRLNFQAFFTS